VARCLLESDNVMNTSQKSSHRFLGDKQIERFLLDCVNSRTSFDEWKSNPRQGEQAMQRMTSTYPEFFEVELPELRTKTSEWLMVDGVQRYLRPAWNTTDPREREWLIFQARQDYFRVRVAIPCAIVRCETEGIDPAEHAAVFGNRVDAELMKTPPLTTLERALYYFQRHSGRARRCANPECPAPYFFASKKGQKYCTSKCSAPSQREQKRRWWRENRAKNGDLS